MTTELNLKNVFVYNNLFLSLIRRLNSSWKNYSVVITGIMAIYGLITTLLVSSLDTEAPQAAEKPIGDDFFSFLSSCLTFIFFPFFVIWHVIDSLFSFIFAIMVCTGLLWLAFALLQGQEVANETFQSIFILIQTSVKDHIENYQW